MVRMLVTRPEPDAQETARRLAALDIEPVLCPLLAMRTLPTGLPEARGFAGIALTSTNAIRALAARGALTPCLGIRAFTVGDRTARAAQEAGFTSVISAGGSFADLVELLAHAGLGGPVFYPAAKNQAGDLAKSLAPYGVMVVTARVYEMTAAEALPAGIVESLQAGRIDAALFYSRRTAAAFVDCLAAVELAPERRRRLGMLCLSEQVAEPLVAARFVRIGLADFPSEEAMMGLCLSFARDQNAP